MQEFCSRPCQRLARPRNTQPVWSSQLLTFSKGGAPLKSVTSISELLGQAAEFSLYGSNLHADIDIPADLWKAEVDQAQIEQVINALMINAREAMPHGGTVRITARNVEFEEKPGLICSGTLHQNRNRRSRQRHC